MHWSVSRRIMAGYILALIVIVLIGVIAFRSTRRFVAIVEMRKQSHEVIVNLERLISQVLDAETAERGFVISGRENYVEAHRAAAKAACEYVDRLGEAFASDARHQAALDELKKSIQAQFDVQNQIIQVRRDPAEGRAKAEARISAGTSKEGMDTIRRTVGNLRKQEQERRDRWTEEADFNATFTEATILVGTLFAFVVLALAGSLISRSISRPLYQAIDVLTASAGQIAQATVEVAANAAATATAVTQTTTTTAEVKQMAISTVQRVKHVADAARHTAQTSETGSRAVADMAAGINRIREQTDSVAASIARLSEQSQAIGSIIATVDDLAAQSNLLAVNAAIEAAKAGEHGKGFAVVAQEVKTLAEQSKQATAQVRSILSDIQKATGATVMATEQSSRAVQEALRQAGDAGHAVRSLSESISESAQAATQIAASSQQQLAGMDQLAQAMESIKQASVQNADSSRQTETAALNLTELGQQLKRIVAGSTR